MRSFLFLVLIFVGSTVLSLAYRGFRSRVRKGRYEEAPALQGPSFTTDEGTFVVNRSSRAVDIMLSSGTFHLPFDDVASLQLEHRVREAMGEEMLFESFSVFDFHRKYRDHVHSYRIVAKTTTQGEVPLFQASQYEVRDFLDFTTPVQLWLLGLLGLHRKAEDVATETMGSIQKQLARGGLMVRTARW